MQGRLPTIRQTDAENFILYNPNQVQFNVNAFKEQFHIAYGEASLPTAC